jgi:hypothetical protein
MEAAFGFDLSGVRVHTDERAAAQAATVGASAYTIGRDIVFGGGQWAPQTPRGRRLLAHELAHVVQQRAFADVVSAPVGPADTAHERDAHAAAEAVSAGAPAPVLTSTASPLLQRDGPGDLPVAKPGSPAWQAAVAKAENDKLGAKQLDELMKAALTEASTNEPLKSLIAKGKEFATSPGGASLIGAAIASVIAGSVLAHQQLPITSYTFDLGTISDALRGISITPTWKGPADKPSEAGVKVQVSPVNWRLSLDAAFQAGTGTPTGAQAGVGYKPGFLPGSSLRAGVSVADPAFKLGPLDPRAPGARVEGSAAFNLKLPPGELGAKGTIDDAGNRSLMLTFTVPLGSAPKKK